VCPLPALTLVKFIGPKSKKLVPVKLKVLDVLGEIVEGVILVISGAGRLV